MNFSKSNPLCFISFEKIAKMIRELTIVIIKNVVRACLLAIRVG